VTTRALFDRRKRRIMTVAFAGFALFAGGVFLMPLGPVWIVPNLLGFAVAFGAMFYGWLFAFRCPQCGGQWAPLAMQGGRSPFRIDPKVHYCPYCAYEIDTEVGEPDVIRR
jgi:hypothetical protein